MGVIIEGFYDKDTYRTHRYLIPEKKGLKGVLYVLKEVKPIPDEVTIRLKVKEVSGKKDAKGN